MKSNETRSICNAFIDLFIRLPPNSVVRYAIMMDIRNPLKQSCAHIVLLCRAQTYHKKKNQDNNLYS